MNFLAKLREALKAKGANAWTEEEMNALLAEDGDLVTAVTSFVDNRIAEETVGLVAKNKELLGEKKKIQAKLTAGSSEDVAEYEEKLEKATAELEATRESLLKTQKDQERATKTWGLEKEKLSASIKSEKEGFNRMLIENELAVGLEGVNLLPQHLPLVKKYLKDSIILVEDNEGRKPIARYVDSDGKEVQVPFKDYVQKIWAPSEEGKSFIISKASGSGANQGARGSGENSNQSNDSADDSADDNPFAEAFGEKA